jgi:hypothetical protein
MLYICIFSNKFDLKQTIRVLYSINKSFIVQTTFITIVNYDHYMFIVQEQGQHLLYYATFE